VRVAVIGGGIAGLAAARRLESIVPDAEIVLVEREQELGGKVGTERVGGFVIERAPDSFLSRKPRGVELCEELDLTEELIARRPEHAQTFVRRGDDLHPLPEGLTGMIPTNLDALERGSLLSAQGLERFREEPHVPVLAGKGDESVGAFVSRRFGREAYEALVEPLMTGIYGGDGDRLSLAATFPQLRAVELEHGSVLSGLVSLSPGARPAFISLRDGMGQLAERLARDLVRTRAINGTAVTRLARTAADYELSLSNGEVVSAAGLVLATPAFATAELVADLDPELAALHAEIPYGSSAVVTLAFSRADVIPLHGYGYLVPRAEGGDVLACTWSSQKWEGRAPEGSVLVRVFVGRAGGRDVTLDTDDELVDIARVELARLDVTVQPTLTRAQRWPLGMPQYVLGHPERVSRIEERLAEHPRLSVAGAAYRGVGIPDCIASGEAAAESVARALSGAAA
jgi:protoporphyrinogen/coproporphyrinogen III oxidase